jgi:hypothetical protein
MHVRVEFKVVFDVDAPDGAVEVGPLRDAIYDGLNRARDEGHLTPLDNEDVLVLDYIVTHQHTIGG